MDKTLKGPPQLSLKEYRWCELNVKSWRQLERRLCIDYTTEALKLLFQYERHTRQRPLVLRRILQRYFKQLKDETTKELLSTLPHPKIKPVHIHPDYEVPECAKKSSRTTYANESRSLAADQ